MGGATFRNFAIVATALRAEFRELMTRLFRTLSRESGHFGFGDGLQAEVSD
jgi:hypothetical protein